MEQNKDLIAKPSDELALSCDALLPTEFRGYAYTALVAGVAGVWSALAMANVLAACAAGAIALCLLGRRTVTIDRRRGEIREELIRIYGLPPLITRHELKGGEHVTVGPVTEGRSRGSYRPPQNMEVHITGYRLAIVLAGGERIPLMHHESLGVALDQRDAIEAFLAGGAANPAAHPAYAHPAAPTPPVHHHDGKGHCLVCGTDMRTEWVRCPKCETPHHASCWRYNGGCATYGCRRAHRV